jgi:hypothetical protein
MLIIINDDAVYVSWISRHGQGFVVDGTCKSMRKHWMLHRARCSAIKPHKRARLTTAGHLKACSVYAVELVAWAREQTGGGVTACRECHPDQEGYTIEVHPTSPFRMQALLALAQYFSNGDMHFSFVTSFH